MPQVIGKQHLVPQSTNIESIGFYNGTPSSPKTGVINVRFARGGVYDYFPCTEDEFQEAFKESVQLKDWFAGLRNSKEFKRIV